MEKFFSEHSSLDFNALKHLNSNYRHNKVPANSKLIASDVYSLGKPLKGTVDSLLDDSEVQALQQVMNVSTVLTEVFSQRLFRNITIHSCQWNKKASSLSSKLPNTATYTVSGISVNAINTQGLYISSVFTATTS